jgi:hypothetical protein
MTVELMGGRWLFSVCVVSAAVFGWAEVTLPPRWNTLLGLVCLALAVLHGLTAVSIALSPAFASRALRLLGWASLGAALVFVGALAGASAELVRMFGALGWGLAALLAAILVLLLALTVPIGIIGLWLTRASHAPS